METDEHFTTDRPSLRSHVILGGAATCYGGFVICFLKVPLVCLGSMGAAVQPNSLGTLFFTKPSEQVAAPRGRGLSALRLQSLRRVRRTSDKESVLRMFMWEEGVVSTRSNATKKMVDSSNRAQCRRINFHLDL